VNWAFAVLSDVSLLLAKAKAVAMRMKRVSIRATPIHAQVVVRAIKWFATVDAVPRDSVVAPVFVVRQASSVEMGCTVNVSL
jgi:hypothetical protein